MGTWGTAISSNDTYEDIFSEFMDLYDDGLEPIDISKRIIKNSYDLIDDYEDKNNFWFALAMAQWQCKSLDTDIFQKVKTIIETGEDIKLWEELGADKQDINKRKKVLNSFLDKLSSEKDKPRKRKRKILRNSIYQKGDCLTFKLDNGKYGGAFVLSSENQTELGLNLIAITTINKRKKPNIDDFNEAYILIRKEQSGLSGFKDREMISWYMAQLFKKAKLDFEVIGNITVNKEYNSEIDYRRFSPWTTIKEIIEINKRYTRKNGKPDKKLKLSQVI